MFDRCGNLRGTSIACGGVHELLSCRSAAVGASGGCDTVTFDKEECDSNFELVDPDSAAGDAADFNRGPGCTGWDPVPDLSEFRNPDARSRQATRTSSRS